MRIPNKFFNPNLPVHPLSNYEYTIYTDQKRITDEMKRAFQRIYIKQPNLKTSANDIHSSLRSDGDTKPEHEIDKRCLSPLMANAMEGLLTDEELNSRNRWLHQPDETRQ